MSAYIPTNVISITDGQIFLETKLFFEGQRPAVNVGLSVSRVGGAAQTKAMKKASGTIRIDLAQYRELEVFTQFSSDLDETTKAQLNHGNALMELLKQPLNHPLSMADQVITLILAQEKYFDDVDKSQVKKLQNNVLRAVRDTAADVYNTLEEKNELNDDIKARIIDAANKYKASR